MALYRPHPLQVGGIGGPSCDRARRSDAAESTTVDRSSSSKHVSPPGSTHGAQLGDLSTSAGARSAGYVVAATPSPGSGDKVASPFGVKMIGKHPPAARCGTGMSSPGGAVAGETSASSSAAAAIGATSISRAVAPAEQAPVSKASKSGGVDASSAGISAKERQQAERAATRARMGRAGGILGDKRKRKRSSRSRPKMPKYLLGGEQKRPIKSQHVAMRGMDEEDTPAA